MAAGSRPDRARCCSAEAPQLGIVGLNPRPIFTAAAPFGGVKDSGSGREGSRHGIREYTERKDLCNAIEPVP